MPRNKRRGQAWSVIGWLAFSLYISGESLRLGIGRPRDPGPGFIFFWSGLVLAALAVLVLRRSLIAHHDNETMAGHTNWTELAPVLVVLALYALLLERIGFLLTTALMTGLIVKFAGEHRWSRIVTFAIGVTLATYTILQVWLQTRLPPGVLGWLETVRLPT